MSFRTMLATAVGVAALVPAAAFAASPAKDSSFWYCTSKNRCPFAFETNKAGTKLVNLKIYNDCARVPAMFPPVKVGKDGRFAASGTVKDVVGDKITYSVKGRFKTAKKAVGTYDADAKGCSEKSVKFVAKRVGKAQPGL